MRQRGVMAYRPGVVLFFWRLLRTESSASWKPLSSSKEILWKSRTVGR